LAREKKITRGTIRYLLFFSWKIKNKEKVMNQRPQTI